MEILSIILSRSVQYLNLHEISWVIVIMFTSLFFMFYQSMKMRKMRKEYKSQKTFSEKLYSKNLHELFNKLRDLENALILTQDSVEKTAQSSRNNQKEYELLSLAIKQVLNFITNNIYKQELCSINVSPDLNNPLNKGNIEYLSDQQILDKPDDHGAANKTELPILLMVGNDSCLWKMLKERFSHLYQIYIACNGREGLKMCMSLKPDAILSEVVLPELDGVEMCRQIKHKLSSIPIILLTSEGRMMSQFESYEPEADLYMESPFSIKRLEDNLHRLVLQSKELESQSKITEKEEARKEATRGAVFTPEERQRMTEKLKQIIMEHLDDPQLSSKQLSQELGLSRSKFYRELKQIDGLSLSDYIRNVRLEKAEELLTHSEYTAKEVIDMTGFVNLSHFSKIFKLKYGMAPVEYKKKKQHTLILSVMDKKQKIVDK